ncbi:MAG: hypothetical protein J1E34_05500 [Oscillospiraceae bacterium]|nr:hypothetical protein [Oscillospiraceae bacterium]
MSSKNYNDLLESIMYQTLENTESSYCYDTDKEKTTVKTKKKEWGKSFFILVIVPLFSLLIGLIDLVTGISADFSMQYVENSESYVILEQGSDIKNSSADLFLMVVFHDRSGDNEYVYLCDYNYSAKYDQINRTYTFEISKENVEQIFCEAMSYLYYDTSDMNFYPEIRFYFHVNYDLSHFPIHKWRKWCKYENGETKDVLNFMFNKDIKNIKSVNERYDISLLEFYKSISHSLDENILGDTVYDFEIPKNIDELITWISDNKAKKLTSKEEIRIRENYEKAFL